MCYAKPAATNLGMFSLFFNSYSGFKLLREAGGVDSSSAGVTAWRHFAICRCLLGDFFAALPRRTRTGMVGALLFSSAVRPTSPQL
jgi:hypothetical protein